MPERSNGLDLGSSGLSLRGFKSSFPHFYSMEKNLQELLEKIPVLAEAPWGKRIPAVARVSFDYAIPIIREGVVEPMTGYVFGKTQNEEAIYFSGKALKETGTTVILSPNLPVPLPMTKYIENFSVETLLS